MAVGGVDRTCCSNLVPGSDANSVLLSAIGHNKIDTHKRELTINWGTSCCWLSSDRFDCEFSGQSVRPTIGFGQIIANFPIGYPHLIYLGFGLL